MRTIVRVFATALFVVFWVGFGVHFFSADVTNWLSENHFAPLLTRAWDDMPLVTPMLPSDWWWAIGGGVTGLFAGTWLGGSPRRNGIQASRKPVLAIDYAKGPPPKLSITQVHYDPTEECTEVFIDFSVVNPGPPTVLVDWQMDVKCLSGPVTGSSRPKSMTTDRIIMTAAGHIAADTMDENPLETGARRTGRMSFGIEGPSARQRMEARGTEFQLHARDMRGNSVSAWHIVG